MHQATPIPRTLSLVSYGDMALSVINELPPGRSPITTRVLFDQAGPRVEVRISCLLPLCSVSHKCMHA